MLQKSIVMHPESGQFNTGRCHPHIKQVDSGITGVIDV